MEEVQSLELRQGVEVGAAAGAAVDVGEGDDPDGARHVFWDAAAAEGLLPAVLRCAWRGGTAVLLLLVGLTAVEDVTRNRCAVRDGGVAQRLDLGHHVI